MSARRAQKTGKPALRAGALGRIAGLSIVEMMVALTIGLILLAALTRLFVTSRSTYTLEEGLARVQESGRFAMEFLAQDIRMAGYIGCASAMPTTVQNNLKDPTAYGSNIAPGQYLRGHTYTGSGTTPSALTDWTPELPGVVTLTDGNSVTYFSAGDVEPYTDVLVVRRGSETSVHLGGPMPITSADLDIDSNPGGLAKGDIVMISDCSGADVFQITGPDSLENGTGNMTHNTGVAVSPGNSSQSFSKIYDTDAQIMKLTTRIYYIGRRSNSTSNPPALFRREQAVTDTGKTTMTTQELAEGVERMKFSYGEDTDTTSDNVPDIYRSSASVVSDWSRITSVRMGILVATTSTVEQVTDTRTYDIAGNSVGPFNDNKRRRAFNSVIQLRNHF